MIGLFNIYNQSYTHLIYAQYIIIYYLCIMLKYIFFFLNLIFIIFILFILLFYLFYFFIFFLMKYNEKKINIIIIFF